MSASSAGGLVVPMPERWIVVLSGVIVFYVGVSMLLALCAARSNPRVDHLNVYSGYSTVREQKAEPPVQLDGGHRQAERLLPTLVLQGSAVLQLPHLVFPNRLQIAGTEIIIS
jgi:hypothetical protein